MQSALQDGPTITVTMADTAGTTKPAKGGMLKANPSQALKICMENECNVAVNGTSGYRADKWGASAVIGMMYGISPDKISPVCIEQKKKAAAKEEERKKAKGELTEDEKKEKAAKAKQEGIQKNAEKKLEDMDVDDAEKVKKTKEERKKECGILTMEEFESSKHFLPMGVARRTIFQQIPGCLVVENMDPDCRVWDIYHRLNSGVLIPTGMTLMPPRVQSGHWVVRDNRNKDDMTFQDSSDRTIKQIAAQAAVAVVDNDNENEDDAAASASAAAAVVAAAARFDVSRVPMRVTLLPSEMALLYERFVSDSQIKDVKTGVKRG